MNNIECPEALQILAYGLKTVCSTKYTKCFNQKREC